jgi:predicted small integral membrane protein
MSATLHDGLTSLATRKTNEARARAKHLITVWRQAILNVREAGKMAGHKLDLPPAIADEFQRLAHQVSAASYIECIDLEWRMQEGIKKSIRFATKQLTAEIHKRGQVESDARLELDALEWDYSMRFAAEESLRISEGERDAAWAKALSRKASIVGMVTGILFSPVMVCLSVIAVWQIAAASSEQHLASRDILSFIGNRLVSLIGSAVTAVAALVITPVLGWIILGAITRLIAEQKTLRRARAVLISDNFAAKAATAEFNARRPALVHQMESVSRHRQTAEQALKWLRGKHADG